MTARFCRWLRAVGGGLPATPRAFRAGEPRAGPPGWGLRVEVRRPQGASCRGSGVAEPSRGGEAGATRGLAAPAPPVSPPRDGRRVRGWGLSSPLPSRAAPGPLPARCCRRDFLIPLHWPQVAQLCGTGHGHTDRAHADLSLSFIPRPLLLLLLLVVFLLPPCPAPFLPGTCKTCAWGSAPVPLPVLLAAGAGLGSSPRRSRDPLRAPSERGPPGSAGPCWISAREGDCGRKRRRAGSESP